MLVVSKERYLPLSINMLVLYAQERYFYIHRDVYDQALILSERYTDLTELGTLVGGYDMNHDTVQWFYEHAPKPIHILAPYLTLIDGEIDKDLELCCGVLHVITSLIQVRHFIEKPLEVRRRVTFSLSIREEYEMAWDRFFMTALPYYQRNAYYGSSNNVGRDVSNESATVISTEEAIQQHADVSTSPATANLESTSRLEGFSLKRDEAASEPAPTSLVSSEAERKTTKSLLL
ncbi:hypothetical protein [Paenibacillus sinopodophylli]|uniref:hypothetical protein n=1 Tax=Paenibacillus sinopodophylli TaxID=1837342 RepID=UPI00110CCA44|nr:hypothetical protein [Paenibacillus sinopodophylli]